MPKRWGSMVPMGVSFLELFFFGVKGKQKENPSREVPVIEARSKERLGVGRDGQPLGGFRKPLQGVPRELLWTGDRWIRFQSLVLFQ